MDIKVVARAYEPGETIVLPTGYGSRDFCKRDQLFYWRHSGTVIHSPGSSMNIYVAKKCGPLIVWIDSDSHKVLKRMTLLHFDRSLIRHVRGMTPELVAIADAIRSLTRVKPHEVTFTTKWGEGRWGYEIVGYYLPSTGEFIDWRISE